MKECALTSVATGEVTAVHSAKILILGYYKGKCLSNFNG